jgi:hypothetical protein
MAVGNPAFGYASESIAARYGAQDFPARLTESSMMGDSTVVVVDRPNGVSEASDSSSKGSASSEDRADETGFHGLGTGVDAEGKSSKKPAVSTM